MLVLPLAAMAQDYVSDDAGRTTGAVWTEVGFTKLLPYDLSIGVDAGFRTDDWFKEANRADIGVGLSWKPNKHWKIGVGYTFLMKHYRTETERKTVPENGPKYKYAATDGAGVETELLPEPTQLHGYPIYTTDGEPYDGTNAYPGNYWYKGYNYSEKTKDYVRVTDAYWRAKHRISLDLSYTTGRLWGWLRVSVRERYQLTVMAPKDVTRTRTKTTTKTTWRYRSPSYDYVDGKMVIDGYDETPDNWTPGAHSYDENPSKEVTEEVETTIKPKDRKVIQTLRSRITLELDHKGWKWTPYVYAEFFNDLGSLGLPNGMHLDKLRLSAGVDYAVAKQHKIGLGYVFNRENDDDGNQTIHAISASYKFKF